MIGIYKITNKRNHLVYIGQSTDLERRLISHMRSYEQSEIDCAIKENPSDFTYEVIELCDKTKLNEREIYWIEYYNSYYQGYNNTPGGSFRFCPEKNSIDLLSDKDIKLIRECYQSNKYHSGAEVQRAFFPTLDKHLIARVYNGQERMDIMPEVYQQTYIHENDQYRQLGELNPKHLVSEDDVLRMRVLYSMKSREEIYSYFLDINPRTIVAIISGQNWKGVPIYHKREKRWTYPKEYTEEKIKKYQEKIERMELEYASK